MQKQNEILGYHFIAPFTLKSGARLLVNVGWVPNSVVPQTIHLPSGFLKLSGIIKRKTERTSYTPENDYKNHALFNLDPAEITHKKTWPSLLPFFITLTSPLPSAEKYPLPIEMQLAIRNSHLEYTLTWYLLALFWLMIFVVYARHKIHQKD